ncbi:hypothetical protein HN832_00595 [archaeon]|jgi:hypothetical protein|nr:hypothetical protein [archaeon]MBT4373880.1 hypothetical protein [archaeon]MBT4532402.1 hypothetical protein [archaeon]MBT7001783.1 hypothetical protein [archaeon]MBT7281892.1 hypothetical protein [archaeon]
MKKIILILVMFCGMMSLVLAGNVTREISSNNIEIGEVVNVSLFVVFEPNTLSYFLQEGVPIQAMIISEGGGSVSGDDIRWQGTAQGGSNLTLIYSINFSNAGTFNFESDNAYQGYDEIFGDFNITVLGPCFENWTCESWTECANDSQERNCTELNGCGTIENKPVEVQDCESHDNDYKYYCGTDDKSIRIRYPNQTSKDTGWNCLAGDTCDRNYDYYVVEQNRSDVRGDICEDESTSGDSSTGTSCIPVWTGSWGSCQNEIQIYSYSDLNKCGTLVGKPSPVTRVCQTSSSNTLPPIGTGSTDSEQALEGGKLIFLIIFIFIVAVIIALLVWLYLRYRNREDSSLNIPQKQVSNFNNYS